MAAYDLESGECRHLHPPGIAKTEGVADGRWGSSVALHVSRGLLRPYVEAN
jgi:hypothetical protein